MPGLEPIPDLNDHLRNRARPNESLDQYLRPQSCLIQERLPPLSSRTTLLQPHEMAPDYGKPLSLSFTATFTDARAVVVTLTDRDPTNPCRRITLDKKNDCCPLGRASRKGADIVAQPDNGYIENPVVSRNHAEIRADFVYEVGCCFLDRTYVPFFAC